MGGPLRIRVTTCRGRQAHARRVSVYSGTAGRALAAKAGPVSAHVSDMQKNNCCWRWRLGTSIIGHVGCIHGRIKGGGRGAHHEGHDGGETIHAAGRSNLAWVEFWVPPARVLRREGGGGACVESSINGSEYRSDLI